MLLLLLIAFQSAYSTILFSYIFILSTLNIHYYATKTLSFAFYNFRLCKIYIHSVILFHSEATIFMLTQRQETSYVNRQTSFRQVLSIPQIKSKNETNGTQIQIILRKIVFSLAKCNLKQTFGFEQLFLKIYGNFVKQKRCGNCHHVYGDKGSILGLQWQSWMNISPLQREKFKDVSHEVFRNQFQMMQYKFENSKLSSWNALGAKYQFYF